MGKDFLEKGLSLAEVLMASALSIIVLGGVLMLTQFAQTSWRNERIKSNLIGQLESSMERIQKEIRQTDAQQIFYYPAGAATYSALSFPLAEDSGGFIAVDASQKIVWSQTVIYHTYVNASNRVELRRTIFDPSGSLTDAERQQQINDVVANGQPVVSTPNFANWDQVYGTRAICENNSIVLTITPSNKLFDGYAASTAKSDNVSFGSVKITPGDHYITFTAAGKNASSSGYRLGIDSLAFSPSGCVMEAEEAAIYGDSGQIKVNEDMSGFGSWNGNRQLEYQAGATGNYISLSFYYDQWRETNFATCLPSYTVTEYGNRTGDAGEQTGNLDYAARLGGFGDSWSAIVQTGAAVKGSESIVISGGSGINFRNVILNRNIDVEGRAVKITFDNTKSAVAFVIDYACVMTRDSGPNGIAGTLKQITFADAGGGASITIPPGASINSDWIDISNFDRSRDYLLTFHRSIPAAGAYTMTSWPTPAPDALDDHSYYLEGDASVAQNPTWSSLTPTAKDVIYTVDSIDASYFSAGTLTSQIYDTALSSPAYGTLAWQIAKNNYGNYGGGGLGADLIIKFRTNSDKDALKASSDWSAALSIDTLSAVTGSASISAAGGGRYCQFQASFISQPTPGKFDYTKSCVLKNLAISWPGQERIVDVSGYFTRRPNYGIFSVGIDGHQLTKGIEVKLEASEKFSSAKTITRTLTVEAEPRNTGK